MKFLALNLGLAILCSTVILLLSVEAAPGFQATGSSAGVLSNLDRNGHINVTVLDEEGNLIEENDVEADDEDDVYDEDEEDGEEDAGDREEAQDRLFCGWKLQ